MTDFEDSVVEVLRGLRRGEVLTYGEVADEAGFPGAARAVGNLLRTCDDDIPWWRVVGSGGYLKAGETSRQAQILRSEGVLVHKNRVKPESVSH